METARPRAVARRRGRAGSSILFGEADPPLPKDLLPADLAAFVLFFERWRRDALVALRPEGRPSPKWRILRGMRDVGQTTSFSRAEYRSSTRSTCDKPSRVADVYRRATKTQSRQSALVCQLEEPVRRFPARNCARRSSGKCDRRLRPMRKPKVESMS